MDRPTMLSTQVPWYALRDDSLSDRMICACVTRCWQGGTIRCCMRSAQTSSEHRSDITCPQCTISDDRHALYGSQRVAFEPHARFVPSCVSMTRGSGSKGARRKGTESASSRGAAKQHQTVLEQAEEEEIITRSQRLLRGGARCKTQSRRFFEIISCSSRMSRRI